MKNNLLLEDLTSGIIACFYNVYNTLGHGFLEKVYEKALLLELKEFGFKVKRQVKIEVFYKDTVVGDYYADLIVDDLVIIELKAASMIMQQHENQLINYLKATNIELGFLFNFGKKAEFKRKIFTNDRK